jgi:hypothetical protein
MVLPPRVRSSAPQPCRVSFSWRRTLLASMVAASAECALEGLSSLRHLGSSRRLLEPFWQLVGRAEVRVLGFEAPDKGFARGVLQRLCSGFGTLLEAPTSIQTRPCSSRSWGWC